MSYRSDWWLIRAVFAVQTNFLFLLGCSLVILVISLTGKWCLKPPTGLYQKQPVMETVVNEEVHSCALALSA